METASSGGSQRSSAAIGRASEEGEGSVSPPLPLLSSHPRGQSDAETIGRRAGGGCRMLDTTSTDAARRLLAGHRYQTFLWAHLVLVCALISLCVYQ